MKARSWKAAETRFARDVGRERKPCDGSRAGADFEDAMFCYQLKVRRVLPAWLWSWLCGASSDRIGVLVLKRPRQADAEALVVLSWRDWRDLHGTPARAEKPWPQATAGHAGDSQNEKKA